MALTFVKNSWQLVNWGFSVTDITTLIGAGRGVITWLNADGRDSNLLSFLNLDETGLDLRPGLLDTTTLNKRWGKEVLLLQNGRPVRLKPEGVESAIEDIRRFTWMMTLITTCLDAALTGRSVENVICNFIASLFDGRTQPGIQEYLQKDIPLHIQGWRSTAAVRMIFPRARDVWNKLERQGIHQSGSIPEQESEGLARMLIWVVTKGPNTLYTASSDVYAVGILLSELGFDSLRFAVGKREYNEDALITLIKIDGLLLEHQIIRPARDIRRGMRIPLSNMEDAVSLWPENPEKNNRRRMIFTDGMSSAMGISFSACVGSKDHRSLGTAIRVVSTEKQPARRADTKVFTLMNRYFLIPTNYLLSSLTNLIGSWNIRQERFSYILQLGEDVFPGDQEDDLGEEFQIFLMGYYYSALGSIVDTSRLVCKEVFGSWGWGDSKFFQHLLQLTQNSFEEWYP